MNKLIALLVFCFGIQSTYGADLAYIKDRDAEPEGEWVALVDYASGKLQKPSDKPQVIDPLKKSEVLFKSESELNEKAKACIVEQQKLDPKLSGKVAFSYVIETDGRITDVKLIGTREIGSRHPIVDCVMKRIREFSYPATNARTPVDNHEIEFLAQNIEGDMPTITVFESSDEMKSTTAEGFHTKMSKEDQAVFERMIRRTEHYDKGIACLESEITRDPTFLPKTTFSIVIQPSGKVTDIQLKKADKDGSRPRYLKCLMKALRNMRYAKSAKAEKTDVEFNYVRKKAEDL